MRKREKIKKRKIRFRFFLILLFISLGIYYFVFKENPEQISNNKENKAEIIDRESRDFQNKEISEEAINIEANAEVEEEKEMDGLELEKEKSIQNENKKVYNKKSLIISKDKVYIYYNKEVVLALDTEINLTKEKTVANILSKKNYRELLNLTNYLVPEKLKSYEVVEDFESNAVVDLDILEIGEKQFIDTYSLADLLIKEYYKLDINKNKNIIIDILNANGIGGSAGTAGKRIQKNFAYKYTAANYEKRTKYSYIINKNMSRQELENLVMALDQKYIKIKKESPISTIADAVIILGREWGYLTRFFVQSNKKLDYEYYNKLKKEYRNVKRIRVSEIIKEDHIEYNPEDYFIAYKLSKLIGIEKMLENEKLKDRININLAK